MPRPSSADYLSYTWAGAGEGEGEGGGGITLHPGISDHGLCDCNLCNFYYRQCEITLIHVYPIFKPQPAYTHYASYINLYLYTHPYAMYWACIVGVMSPAPGIKPPLQYGNTSARNLIYML